MLALKSAMRRGELLSLRWENVDFTAQMAYLPITKKRHFPNRPVIEKSCGNLAERPNSGALGQVFAISHMTIHNCFNDAYKGRNQPPSFSRPATQQPLV